MTNTFKVTLLATYGSIVILMLLLSTYKPIFALFFVITIVFCLLFLAFLSKKLTINHYVMILVPSIILSPIITIPGFFADLRIDDLWLGFGLLIFLTKLSFRRLNTKMIFPSYVKLYLMFIVWIAVTILISSFREPHLYSVRDWTEVYKSLKLLIYLLIAVNLKLNSIQLKSIMNLFLVFLSISAVFGILQYFNFADVNGWLTPYYIFETKVYNLEAQRRIVGTFGNPNIFGIAMLIGFAISFSNLLSNFKVKYILLIVLFLTAITMSLSRTALVASVLLVAFMALSSLWRAKKKKLVLFIFSLTPVIGAIGLLFAPDIFFRRLSGLSNISSDSSFQARLWMWEGIWETRTKINMITGTGPVSTIQMTFDNEWLELLTYYGFTGVLIFLVVFSIMYIRLGRLDSNNISFYNITARVLLLVFAISMSMFTVYNQLQLMPIIILLVGVTLGVTTENQVIKRTP